MGNGSLFSCGPGSLRCSNDCLLVANSTSLKLRPVGDIPSDLLCGVCKELLKEPIQTSCGERFCQECCNVIVNGDPDPTCPLCGEVIDPKRIWKDAFAARELRQLVVHCPNCDEGCQWTGQRGRLEDHLSHCSPGLQTKCPTEGRSERVQVCRQSLGTKEVPPHSKCCPRKPVECPILNCAFKASPELMTDHMESHVGPHVEMINDACVSIQQEVASLGGRVYSELNEQHQIQRSCQDQLQGISQCTNDLEGQMTDLAAQQKIMQQKTLEACYQSVDNLQKEMKSKMDSLDNHLRLLTEKYIKLEEITAMQSARIQQLEEEETRNQKTSDMVQSVQQQFQAQDRVLAAHDIKLAEHGLRLDMMDCKDIDGVLLWKITEIRKKRREAVAGKTPSIYSQPFYTSPNGYKMCARLYLNGDGMGRGTHLSLFFVVMRGDFDSILPWPFQQKVSLILIDQNGGKDISDTFRPDPSSPSLQRPQSDMNVASGCPLFVSLVTLDGGGYIKDDTMFIKIAVDDFDPTKPFAHNQRNGQAVSVESLLTLHIFHHVRLA